MHTAARMKVEVWDSDEMLDEKSLKNGDSNKYYYNSKSQTFELVPALCEVEKKDNFLDVAIKENRNCHTASGDLSESGTQCTYCWPGYTLFTGAGFSKKIGDKTYNWECRKTIDNVNMRGCLLGLENADKSESCTLCDYTLGFTKHYPDNADPYCMINTKSIGFMGIGSF